MSRQASPGVRLGKPEVGSEQRFRCPGARLRSCTEAPQQRGDDLVRADSAGAARPQSGCGLSQHVRRMSTPAGQRGAAGPEARCPCLPIGGCPAGHAGDACSDRSDGRIVAGSQGLCSSQTTVVLGPVAWENHGFRGPWPPPAPGAGYAARRPASGLFRVARCQQASSTTGAVQVGMDRPAA